MRRFSTIIIAAVAAVLAGCNPEASVPSANPLEDRDREMRGFVYNPDALSLTETEFAWAQQALSGYRRASASDVPARIGRLRVAGCEFPVPTADERVFLAHLGGGVQGTPMHWVAEDEVKSRAQAVLEGFTRRLSPVQLENMTRAQNRMAVVNVVVTETTAPVYLVLGSEDAVVWNIQAAPGVRISRIAVISGRAAAVANAPPNARISALAGSWTRRCGAYPHRMPRDDWGFIVNAQSANGRSGSLEDIVRENKRDAAAYNAWLARTFGIRRGADFAGALGVSNVLMGPLPTSEEQRVPFRPLEGADVYVTSEGHLFPAGEDQYRAGVEQLVQDALIRAGASHVVDYMEGS
jgi:hypothetical protein